MTYLTFHVLFILPPILLLAAVVRPRRKDAFVVLALCAIALVYTTPWDNYLVYRNVWNYGPDRVVGTIGYVPIEEYLFFLLQPVLSGLTYLFVAYRWPGAKMASARTEMASARTEMAFAREAPPSAADSSEPRTARFPGAWGSGIGKAGVSRVGAVTGLAITAAGAGALTAERTLYLGLILVWSGPVIAGQWYWSGRAFLTRRWAAGILIPTVYLWIADRIAIGNGIWTISERYTVGLEPFGLPIEEAVFFLLTNVLVVQGIIMLRGEPYSSPRK